MATLNLTISVSIQDPDDSQPIDRALEAIADYFAREWNGTSTARLLNKQVVPTAPCRNPDCHEGNICVQIAVDEFDLTPCPDCNQL